MEWSFKQNRSDSVLERLLEPPRFKNWFEHFFCFQKKSKMRNTPFDDRI